MFGPRCRGDVSCGCRLRHLLRAWPFVQGCPLMLKFVFCLSLLLSTDAYAEAFPQTAPAPDAATAAETNMIAVTATRTLTLIDQVPASVTVLGTAALGRDRKRVA